MNNTVVVAYLSLLISPMILQYLTNRSRRKEKQLDWDREDKKENEKSEKAELVAKQAEHAAELLLASNASIAKTADASAKIVNAKLEVIRVDVNSNMTAAMKAELDAIEGQVALLREVVELKQAAGIKPTSYALAQISVKDERINELSATLKERLAHTEEIPRTVSDKQLISPVT